MNNSLVSRSWREAVFYADTLREMFNLDSAHLIKRADTLEKADVFLLNGISTFSAESIGKILASTSQKSANNDLKAELILFLQKSFNEKEQLNSDDFEWIKSDKKICAFCYYFLKTHTLYKQDKDSNYDLKWDRYAFQHKVERDVLNSILDRKISMRLFKTNNRGIEPNSHKNRFKIVKSTFLNSEIELSGQKYIMRLLSEAWTKSLQEETNIKFSKWLNAKDHQKVTWLCDYAKKQDDMFYLPWDPINEEERYLALQAEFDYAFLQEPKDNKYLFMQARLAWNQVTARNKKNGPKSRGISMLERTSKRLDWLAEHKGEKINAVIKEIVDKEFEQLNGPEKI
jgi:hypothetical protein